MKIKICISWISETWIKNGTCGFYSKVPFAEFSKWSFIVQKRSYVTFSWDTLRKGKVVPEIYVQAWVLCLRNVDPVERIQSSTVRLSRTYPAKLDVREKWTWHCLLAFPSHSVILLSLSRAIISCSVLPFMRTFSWPWGFWGAFSLKKVQPGGTCWRLPMELRSPEYG